MRKRYILAVAVGTIALLLGLRTGSSASASQSKIRNEDQEQPIATRAFDRWGYEATQLGEGIYIRISSSVSGKSALRALLVDNNRQQSQLFQSVRQNPTQQIPVTIIMQEPVKTEDFVSLVKGYGIQVQSYTLIAQDNTGELITFFGAPVDGELFPEHILKAMVGNIEQAQNKEVSVKGVVSIDAKVDESTLTKLNGDPGILGVDITPALALQDLIQQVQGVDISSVHITSAPFYWETVRQQ